MESEEFVSILIQVKENGVVSKFKLQHIHSSDFPTFEVDVPKYTMFGRLTEMLSYTVNGSKYTFYNLRHHEIRTRQYKPYDAKTVSEKTFISNIKCDYRYKYGTHILVKRSLKTNNLLYFDEDDHIVSQLKSCM
jgi:hypothetical protein